MGREIVKRVVKVEGMSCASCELRISNALKRLDGIKDVKASFINSNVEVQYDDSKVDFEKIAAAIEKAGYKPAGKSINSDKRKKPQVNDKLNINQLIGIGIIVFAVYTLINKTIGFNFIPQVNQSMGYGILFFVGLLTSLHCVAMCGGINLSQCVSRNLGEEEKGVFPKLRPSLLYNLGRVMSYTIIGGIVGAIGSVVSFSGAAKGIVAIISGVFMVIMGLNMLNIFPWLRRLNPRMPKVFGNKVYNSSGKHGPFYVGLLNGLMPCGPLQAMQLYALGTGSFIAGAASMFFFSIGTVPLMFGLGALSSFLSSRFTHKMLKVSAVLVVVLGIIMVNRGLNLSGLSLALASGSSSGSIAKIEGGLQVVSTKLESGNYPPIVVQKGIPVKWNITAKESDLNGCNNPLTIPKYNIEKRLVPGDNVIEFTPEEAGNITYTCWMGMISGNIKVVEDITKASGSDLQQADTASGSSNAGGILGGSCCADSAKATKFAGGRIPTDSIAAANVTGGTQEVTVTVNDEGYSPAVVVLQKGIKAKIKFNTQKLNSCNNIVVFPEYNGQIDLNRQNETPYITPESDFTFQCWMGMLHGYVKVVDDINNINKEDIKREVEAYSPPPGGKSGCCG